MIHTISNLQRFDILGKHDLSMAPQADGDYVLYTDVIAALQSAGQAKAVATVENGVLNWIDGCQLAGPVDLVIGQIDGLQHTQVDFLT